MQGTQKVKKFLLSLCSFYLLLRQEKSIDQMKTVKSESCNKNTLNHSTTGFIPKLNNA